MSIKFSQETWLEITCHNNGYLLKWIWIASLILDLFFVSNFQCFHSTPFYFWEHMVLSWSNMRVLLASPADFFLWKVKTFLKKISRFQHLFINRNSEIELRSYNTYYPDVLDSFCLSFLIPSLPFIFPVTWTTELSARHHWAFCSLSLIRFS